MVLYLHLDTSCAGCDLLGLVQRTGGDVPASAPSVQIDRREVHAIVHDDDLQIPNEGLDDGVLRTIDRTGGDVRNHIGGLKTIDANNMWVSECQEVSERNNKVRANSHQAIQPAVIPTSTLYAQLLSAFCSCFASMIPTEGFSLPYFIFCAIGTIMA